MPLLSVIVPAYNEEKYLSQTLERLSEILEGVDAELIVVDNNSTDKTAEIARGYGARVVFESVNQISRARNAGAKMAQGKYFVFIDADTLVEKKHLEIAVKNLSSGKCVGGGAFVLLDGELPFLGRKLTSLWNWISKTYSLAAGSFLYCTREGFETVGGFSEVVYASEEIWFAKALKKWGKRQEMDFRILETAVISSGRKFEWYSPLYLFLVIVFFGLFPFATRSKRLSKIWYKRPKML